MKLKFFDHTRRFWHISSKLLLLDYFWIFVPQLFQVFESREELQQEARRAVPAPETVCLTKGEYHTMVSAVLALIAILLTISLVAGLAYRRYWSVMQKNISADRSSLNLSSSYPNTRSSPVSSISMFGAGLQKSFTGLGRARNFPSLPKTDDIDCPSASPGGCLKTRVSPFILILLYLKDRAVWEAYPCRRKGSTHNVKANTFNVGIDIRKTEKLEWNQLLLMYFLNNNW